LIAAARNLEQKEYVRPGGFITNSYIRYSGFNLAGTLPFISHTEQLANRCLPAGLWILLPETIISMYTKNAFDAWAEQALQLGRPTPTDPLQMWEDYDVAQEYLYVRDQIRTRILDIQSLEIWVWVTGPSNAVRKKELGDDLETLQEQYDTLTAEIERRKII
jgi:hypothetical protein